ncbi:MAG: F0F1 ATP synthase subunit B [Legionellales bacterium]|nr:F0F1 ATP synthase subunit B [Legionellales bacterium]
MNLNLTLLGQMLTFLVLVVFTTKYIWPYMMRAIELRQETIADGLAAADRGKHELELAQHKAAEILRDARLNAAKYVEQAAKRATGIIEESKEHARVEAERILTLARDEITIQRCAAREALRQEIASIALQGAAKVLGHSIDGAIDNKLIEQLIAEVADDQ